MSFASKFTITDTIVSGIAHIERLRGFLEATQLSERSVIQMQERALIAEAHYTTHIEGTALSLEESEKLLAGELLQGVNPDDRQELLNYREAFNFVSEYLNSKGPISQGLIREIHKKLVEGVRGNKAAPGEYRKVQNYVVNSKTQEVIYTPPPSYEVPRLMTELVEWLERKTSINPILVAGLAQFQLVDIHPLLDGNGRAARLLSSICLYRSGYDFKRLFSISEYYDRDRPDYYRAIQTVRDNGMDLTPWLEYFVIGLKTQLIEVETLVTRMIAIDHFAVTRQLTKTQHQILQLILQHGRLSLGELAVLCHDISKRTLQREIKSLLENHFLEATGATKNRVYHIYTKAFA